MAENEKETPPFPWTGEQIRAKETCPNCGAKPVEQFGFYLRFECGSDGEFGLPQGEILHGQTETCARLAAAEREVERLKSEVDGYQDAFDTQHAEIERLLGLLALTPPAEGAKNDEWEMMLPNGMWVPASPPTVHHHRRGECDCELCEPPRREP